MFQWLGIVICAVVTIARSEVFEKVSNDPWPWYVIGLLAFAAARPGEELGAISRKSLVWIIPLVICSVAWGATDSAPAWLLLGAALSSLALERWPRWAFVSRACSTAGMVVFFQVTTIAIFSRYGADAHAWPWLTGTLTKLLGLLGVSAGDVDGTLVVAHSDALHRFAPGFDQMGGLFATAIAIGALPVLWLDSPRPWRAWLWAVVILAAYGVLRYLVLICTYRMHVNPTYVWRVWPQAATWLPCVFVLARAVKLSSSGSAYRLDLPSAPTARARWVAVTSVIVGALCVVGVSFHGPGELKLGRVLFDEQHSDWEWTDQPMGTEKFGLGTSYNYSNLYEHLDRYYSVSRNRRSIDQVALRECDVLVLRTPTQAYAQSEIQAIREFVEQGGGLWMIGDHTDVFGTSTRMNELSTLFGIRFRKDAEYDVQTGSLNVFEVPSSGVHPVVSRMPDFLFATGCTLETSPACQPVMNVNAVNTLPADYSQRSFFPRDGARQDFGIGIYTMCAAREYGRGRVLALSDSTVFSNFFMYIPGKPELALGSIDWLNRKSTWTFLPLVTWVCAGIAAVSLLLLCVGGAVQWLLPRIVLGLLCGAGGATYLCDVVTRAGYPELKAIKSATRVHFDIEHSGIFLPIARLQGDGDNDYSTFFTWSQRIDLVPTVEKQLEHALKEPGLLVLADLDRPLSEDELRDLEDHVRSGVNLLIIHGPRGSDEAVLPVLSRFDFAISDLRVPPVMENSSGTVLARESAHRDPVEQGAAQVALAAPFAAVTCSHARPVHGGQPLVLDEKGEAMVAWSKHGAGRVIVVGCGELFAAQRMGTVSSQPDEAHRQIYELAFALLRLGSNKAEPPLANLLGQDFAERQSR